MSARTLGKEIDGPDPSPDGAGVCELANALLSAVSASGCWAVVVGLAICAIDSAGSLGVEYMLVFMPAFSFSVRM